MGREYYHLVKSQPAWIDSTRVWNVVVNNNRIENEKSFCKKS